MWIATVLLYTEVTWLLCMLRLPEDAPPREISDAYMRKHVHAISQAGSEGARSPSNGRNSVSPPRGGRGAPSPHLTTHVSPKGRAKVGAAAAADIAEQVHDAIDSLLHAAVSSVPARLLFANLNEVVITVLLPTHSTTHRRAVTAVTGARPPSSSSAPALP